MSTENPFAKSGPREDYAEAEKEVAIEELSLQDEKGFRSRHANEFFRDVKENPLYLLGFMRLLAANLPPLLAKRRLHSAEKRKEGVLENARTEAFKLDQKYEALKGNVLKAEANFKESLQELADFEAENLR